MDEPDWAKIVRVLYYEAPDIPDEEISKRHPFVTNTDLDPQTAEEAVVALKNWGMVEEVVKERKGDYDPETGKLDGEVVHGYRLESDGFDVAHERELSSRQNRINRSISIFTVTLVVVEVIAIIPAGELMKLGLSLIVLLLLLIILLTTDIIE